MRSVPMLHHFFHRPLISIGPNDSAGLAALYAEDEACPDLKDWMIALQWDEDEERKGWKLVVYPVSERRAFWLTPAFYESPDYVTFDRAWALSETVKEHAVNDLLTSSFVHQERSNQAAI